MNFRRIAATMITTLALLATLGAGAVGAAPSNAPSAQTIAVSCAPNMLGIATAVVVTNGNGNMTPGHIVELNGQPSNDVGIPLEIQGTFTSAGGTFSFDQVKPGNRNGITETATCSGSETFTDEQGNTGTFAITVTVFIAPRG